MLRMLVSQLGFLLVWCIVFAGGVIFLRRGRTHGAMSVLFGTSILVLIEMLYLAIMALTRTGVMDRVAGAQIYAVMWVPQVLGGFLFALGFLQLARAAKQEG